MTTTGGMPSVESVVLRAALRAAVGNRNYAIVEQVAELLDALKQRGVIGEDGLSNVLASLADEIVTATVLREFGKDLLDTMGANDTSTPEDSSS